MKTPRKTPQSSRYSSKLMPKTNNKVTMPIDTTHINDVPLRNFLEIPYDKLEELNLAAKEKRDTRSLEDQEIEYREYLEKEKRIKAITLCFTDIEGKLHMLDYDKKFLLASADNLTFDGSSIRGFTPQRESDLRLQVDWTSFLWLPADLFGPGKVILFANVLNR